MLATSVKHPQKVIIWSIISTKGTGRMHAVEGNMNATQYTQVVQTRVLPQLREWFGDVSECTFQHDRAPCHTAKAVTKILSDAKVQVLGWPGNNPDMNPIENIWGYMKAQIAKNPPTNRTALIGQLVKLWNHDDKLQDVCKSAILSMPQRIKDVIAAKGGHTKY